MDEPYLKNVKFLIVDDHAFTRRMLVQVMRTLGVIDVRSAADGEDAWQALMQGMTDIVLLDWAMSPLDGIAFTKRLRKGRDSPNPHLPVIMMTAYADRPHVMAARDAGVNEYLIKPFSTRDMFARIQAVIERPRQFVRVGDFFGPDRRRKEKKFEGGDKRGSKAGIAQKPQTGDMQQDEVDALFNPDDAKGKEKGNGTAPAANGNAKPAASGASASKA